MIAAMGNRRETPRKRKNPSGAIVWMARWTDKTGRRRNGFKEHGIKGTYPTKRAAQEAIDACYELDEKGPGLPNTVGEYAATWTKTHPRMKVTDRTSESRLRAVLDVEIDGAKFRDWPLAELRRRHANALVDHMLRVQGRAYSGANSILATLSSMLEDAIDDEVAEVNPFRGMKRVRANDPRVQKERRPVRVFSWQQMHEVARCAADAPDHGEQMREWRRVYAEPMLRTLMDLGLRVGELLPLCRCDLDFGEATMQIRWSVSGGHVEPGTKTDHGEVGAGRVVPVPPDLLRMLDRMPKRLDATVWRAGSVERLLFPAPRGGRWTYQAWHRFVWTPAIVAAGVEMRPHETRHSYVSLLRAAGIDAADLATSSGHTVETATKKYVHGLGRSFEAIRNAVGE